MGITRIAYFVYFTKDMVRAKAFYTDVLGLKVGAERGAWMEFDIEGGRFALHLSEDTESPNPLPEGSGIIGFAVDDLDAFAARLREQHVTMQGDIREEGFGRLLNIQDPDGNVINLFQPAQVMGHSCH